MSVFLSMDIGITLNIPTMSGVTTPFIPCILSDQPGSGSDRVHPTTISSFNISDYTFRTKYVNIINLVFTEYN